MPNLGRRTKLRVLSFPKEVLRYRASCRACAKNTHIFEGLHEIARLVLVRDIESAYIVLGFGRRRMSGYDTLATAGYNGGMSQLCEHI